MTTVSAKFTKNGPEYTYLVREASDLRSGDVCLAEVGADRLGIVTITEIHNEDRRDPNASFEYRRIFGPASEIRAFLAGKKYFI